MPLKSANILWAALSFFLLSAVLVHFTPAHAANVSPAAVDAPIAPQSGSESIVLAGGCFWGMQELFEHVKGVTKVVSGYAGGDSNTAHYEMVSRGDTGHAESVQVTFDPSQITLGKILQVYFSVAHDPTQLDRQGPDTGTQYRSSIFFKTPQQQEIAEAYITQLQAAKTFAQPVVTTVAPLNDFYPAETYHQDFAKHHPDNAYIMINDAPKVRALEKEFPQIYSP